VPVVTFFHNVEVSLWDFRFARVGLITKLLYLPLRRAIYKAEKNAVLYSKYIMTLNRRDSNELTAIYHRSADILFPTSFYDTYDTHAVDDSIADTKQLLFVGSDFFGNTEGLFWFIESCLDEIDAELMVVGSGMDRYTQKYSRKRVKFAGYVTDIAACYYKAAAVVLPILSGSGMKTKTCEALMYGKTIFGTKEAFEGYDALDVYKDHWLCNTAEDFIVNINNYLSLKKSKISNYSREVFINNYSSELWEERIYKFLAV
jgi:hypothetical protein